VRRRCSATPRSPCTRTTSATGRSSGSRCAIPSRTAPSPWSPTTTSTRSSGPGAVKITPAHDPNDHAIAAPRPRRHRHHGRHGVLTDVVGERFAGEDRFAARGSVKDALREARPARAGRRARAQRRALLPLWHRVEPRLSTSGSWRCASSRTRRRRPSATAAPCSCPSRAPSRSSSGSTTSTTGASHARSGGATASRPGTAQTGRSGSPATTSTRTAGSRTRTSSTPGSARSCGPSASSAGRSARVSSRPGSRPRCWSRATTSTPSGCRAC
jgi:hypothetical protein